MKNSLWLCVVLLISLTSCSDFWSFWDSPKPWVHPTNSDEERVADEARCRRHAQEMAEREYALSQSDRPTTSYSRTAEWQTSQNRFSARSLRDRLFENCMRDFGYRRADDPDR